MQSLIFMSTTFRAWNLNGNVNKVSAARRPYFSFLIKHFDQAALITADKGTEPIGGHTLYAYTSCRDVDITRDDPET